MTTAQQIVEAAYARSTANDPGKLATDAELLGRGNRTYQGLWSLASRQRPDEFAVVQTLTLSGSDAHVALPVDLVDVHRLRNASQATVHLIPAAELDRLWHIAPSMYRTSQTLYSRGKAGDPVAGDVLQAWVLLAGTTLSALASVIDPAFPTRHVELLINDLALYLDAKDEDRDPQQFRKLATDQAAKSAAFAAEYDLAASAMEFVHAPSTRVAAQAGEN